MNYRLKSHGKLISDSLPAWGYILLCQLPEGITTFIQKQWELAQPNSSGLLFVLVYPLFCVFSSISTSLTYLIIKKYRQPNSVKSIFLTLSSSIFLLSGSAIFLGLIILPAILAFIFPGIIVMAFYLFVTFLILEDPNRPFWSFFSASKLLYNQNKIVCVITSVAMISISLFSFLGFLDAPLVFEIIISIFLGFIFNIWLSTLFIEVTHS